MILSSICYSIPPKTANDSITIISHRGARGYAPENSLSAVKMGVLSVADRIEIDIQQTKDSVLVLMHDKSIDRTTNGSGNVRDLTFAEIEKFRIDMDTNFKEEKIPTLESIIQEISGKKNLIIEIKQGNDYSKGIEKRAALLIKKYNAYSWCIIHSFNDKVLKLVYQLDSTIVLNKLLVFKMNFFPLILDFKLRFKGLKKYDYVKEFSINYPFANKKIVRYVHALHKKINVWTVNDQDICKKMINMGVDGIITDIPNEILGKIDY